MMGASFLYDSDTPAVDAGRERDDAFFARHADQVWRVGPLLDGECPMAEGMRARGTGCRAYPIVIDHVRAADRRARAGRGVHHVIIREDDKAVAGWRLTQEAVRWAEWFRFSSTTLPPVGGTGAVP